MQQACLRNVPGNTIKRDIVTSPDKYGDNFSQMHFIAASPLVTAAPQHDAVRLTFSCFWSDHITSPFYNLEINQQLASGGQHFIETFLQVRFTQQINPTLLSKQLRCNSINQDILNKVFWTLDTDNNLECGHMTWQNKNRFYCPISFILIFGRQDLSYVSLLWL